MPVGQTQSVCAPYFSMFPSRRLYLVNSSVQLWSLYTLNFMQAILVVFNARNGQSNLNHHFKKIYNSNIFSMKSFKMYKNRVKLENRSTTPLPLLWCVHPFSFLSMPLFLYAYTFILFLFIITLGHNTNTILSLNLVTCLQIILCQNWRSTLFYLFIYFWEGKAWTYSSTTTNCAVEFPKFGKIARVGTPWVQWMNITQKTTFMIMECPLPGKY